MLLIALVLSIFLNSTTCDPWFMKLQRKQKSSLALEKDNNNQVENVQLKILNLGVLLLLLLRHPCL
jgi:hypothetical protein